MSNGLYFTILFVHILAGATWVGSGIAIQGHVESVLRKEGQVAADRVLHQFSWATKWIFVPVPLLALATGITMVVANSGIGFGDLWVIIALTLFVLSVILAGGFGGAYEKKLKAHGEAGTVDSPEYLRLLRGYLRLSSTEMVAILAIVSMMVFRPL